MRNNKHQTPDFKLKEDDIGVEEFTGIDTYLPAVVV
jgi:hypothetical protein